VPLNDLASMLCIELYKIITCN